MCSIGQVGRVIRSSAPGKLILCGEHAVVYGQPAIALPVLAVTATETITSSEATPDETTIMLALDDLGERWRVHADSDHPLAALADRTLQALEVGRPPPLNILLRSTIPIAGGMGSGAALGAALVQALAAYFDRPLDAAAVSTLVYESERCYHGTPSGIDNTVVSYGRPIWYQRDPEGGAPQIEPLTLGGGLTLVIGDTGVRAPTRTTVGGVRERFNADPHTYQARFEAIGQVTTAIRAALVADDLPATGRLLDENQRLLQAIGVSSPELDRLVAAARGAGARGAKLSGGGGGGIMVALASEERVEAVQAGLLKAGAARVIVTRL